MEKSKIKNNKHNMLYIIGISCIVLCALIYSIIYKTRLDEKYEGVLEPKQTATSGSIIKRINGVNVALNLVANYQIMGRVVDVERYNNSGKISDEYSMLNSLSQIDLGISWNDMAISKNNNKVTWISKGDRHLQAIYKDRRWVDEMGGLDKINQSWSNNHLIPSNNIVAEDINKIKVGDFVKIEGYLVNLMCELTAVKYIKYYTSMTRTDTGSGACEVIYVTNVTWI